MSGKTWVEVGMDHQLIGLGIMRGRGGQGAVV